MNFKKYRIADLIDDISMGPFGSNIKVDCFVDSGVPVLNGSNLDGFTLKEESFRYVTEEKADSLKRANAKKGSYYTSWNFGTNRLYPSECKIRALRNFTVTISD